MFNLILCFMSKSSVSMPSLACYGVPLFVTPVPNPHQVPSQTILVTVDRSSDGSSVHEHVCLENVVNEHIPLNFEDVVLSNLVSKGVEPHALDLLDTSKLGVDSSIDGLANYLISHSSDFVNTSN